MVRCEVQVAKFHMFLFNQMKVENWQNSCPWIGHETTSQEAEELYRAIKAKGWEIVNWTSVFTKMDTLN